MILGKGSEPAADDAKHDPFSALSSLLERLERAPTEVLLREPSLQSSHRDPATFFTGVLRALRAQIPALRSQIGVGIDIFYDLCLARYGGERPALRYYNRETGWEVLSYQQLALAASRMAARWQQAGAKPGTQVALLCAMGPELCVGLLASFKLGLVPTLIAPTGSAFIRWRLRSSGATLLATTPLLHRVMSTQTEWEGTILPPLGGLGSGPELPTTHLYPDDDPICALFSLGHDKPDVPVPLPARQAFLIAARDGLLGLRLRPGDSIACVGGELLQYQPTLLMASLLAGATFVHVEAQDLERDPMLLVAQPLRALLLTAGGAAQLARGPRGLLSSVRALFCEASQESRLDKWRHMLEPLGDVPPLFAIFYDAAAGGTTLWSGRQPMEGLLTMMPAPGVPFALKTVGNGPGSPLIARLILPATQPWGKALFTELPTGHYFLCYVAARRTGHTFPAAEVLEVANQLFGIDATAMVDLPPLPGSLHNRYHLVVFIGPSDAQAEIEERLQQEILRQLPPSHMPDAIVALPLFGRRKEGAVDAPWIRVQYLQGRLQRKAADPLFARLTKLRQLARRQAADGGPAPQ